MWKENNALPELLTKTTALQVCRIFIFSCAAAVFMQVTYGFVASACM
jgi:hypothetical protein